MNRIISYRGLLADGAQDTINLHTNNGKTGYKIIKFELFPNTPNVNQSSLVSLFKVEPSAVPTTADFEDSTMVASGLYISKESNFTSDLGVIFDNEVFNQDIYITHSEINGTRLINYYIELEQVSLSEDQALVAIVKNLRNEQ